MNTHTRSSEVSSHLIVPDIVILSTEDPETKCKGKKSPQHQLSEPREMVAGHSADLLQRHTHQQAPLAMFFPFLFFQALSEPNLEFTYPPQSEAR